MTTTNVATCATTTTTATSNAALVASVRSDLRTKPETVGIEVNSESTIILKERNVHILYHAVDLK